MGAMTVMSFEPVISVLPATSAFKSPPISSVALPKTFMFTLPPIKISLSFSIAV